MMAKAEYLSNDTFRLSDPESSGWTVEEDALFENYLSSLDDLNQISWSLVRQMFVSKTEEQLAARFEQLNHDIQLIENGRVELPLYSLPTTPTLSQQQQQQQPIRRRHSVGTVLPMLEEKERKKAIPWSSEEHRQFLLGLQKHGKGDWRNISRNFVRTRTPSQVASHAQKYFMRQKGTAPKDRRRSSIHDMPIPTSFFESDEPQTVDATESLEAEKSLSVSFTEKGFSSDDENSESPGAHRHLLDVGFDLSGSDDHLPTY
eukprot:TRINITY_DN793_c0_g2_i3.p1 TRINITY_DN793_c0_g2~~TRINITY_DN793_c0_g2_i3.p1  ORF type:complete len:260 (-),score=55.31 TRINITY_DN793_c0_g2_i3:315-1094(-)